MEAFKTLEMKYNSAYTPGTGINSENGQEMSFAFKPNTWKLVD